MQGIFIAEPGGATRRPKSKKEIRELVRDGDADRVIVESTSLFGDDEGGQLTSLRSGRIDFVGPDPYRSRKFYGNIIVTGEPGDASRKYVVK